MGKGNEEWDYAGTAPIFRHRRSGKLAVRDDSGPRVAGDDYEGDDYEGEDELAGEVGEIGDRLDRLERRLARSNERQENRNERRDNRQEKMNDRMDNRQSKIRSKIRDERSDSKGNNSKGNNSNKGSANVIWGPAMQAGEVTGITAAGLSKSIETRIENYDVFKIEDLTFEGSTDTLARVKQIWLGGKIVWNSDVGVPITLFSPTSTMRKVLGNTPMLRGGLRIKVELVTGSGGTGTGEAKSVVVTFSGKGGQKHTKRCN